MGIVHRSVSAFALFFSSHSIAHVRLECPPPRSARTGEKNGPCDAMDDPSLPPFPLIPNALNTITWLESIPHPAAPARLALSWDGNDSVDGFENCVLLDHIPHDENSSPSFRDPLSYHRQSITVFIPDIYCERCHLQLISVMSDESHGVPKGTACAYKGAQDMGKVTTDLKTCPAVYHSCAPVSINGSVPRNETMQCNTQNLETRLEWPFSRSEEYGTYFFRGNPGLYDDQDSRLLAGGAPIEGCLRSSFCDPSEFFRETVKVPKDAQYRALEGSCAPIVNMVVEGFQLGKLPDQLKLGVSLSPSPAPPEKCRERAKNSFEYKRGAMRTCKWLRKRPEDRREKICVQKRHKYEAYNVCPQTCGTSPCPA